MVISNHFQPLMIWWKSSNWWPIIYKQMGSHQVAGGYRNERWKGPELWLLSSLYGWQCHRDVAIQNGGQVLGGWAPRTWIRGDRITPIYKPCISPICKGNVAPLGGLTSHGPINHLLNGMILQVISCFRDGPGTLVGGSSDVVSSWQPWLISPLRIGLDWTPSKWPKCMAYKWWLLTVTDLLTTY